LSGGVLITGFPNVASRVLVRRLLATDGGGQLFLLLPPQSESDAQGFIAQLDATQTRRVVPIVGRLGAIDLGLSGPEYRRLADHVTQIHHTVPIVSPSVERRVVEEANIAATREILEFARVVSEIECLVFHSSVLVAGDVTGLVHEAARPGTGSFRCSAERALATAEAMVQVAMDRVPIVLIRAGLQSCDSRTGEADPDSPLASLIAFLARARRDWPVFIPGTGDARLPVVPIDYLVDVSLRIAKREDSLGKIFHVVDPHPPSVAQVFQWVRGGAAPTRNVPLGLGRALFAAPGPLSWANTPRMLLDLMSASVDYDTTNTDAVLADAGLICPHFEDYVARFAQNLTGGRRARRSAAAAEV
jgi:nucleoside-diphosphate-sugar epimerase